MGTIKVVSIRLLARAEQKKKKKWQHFFFFFLGFLHASAGCECAIVKHFVKLFNDVYIPRSFSLFQGIELQLFCFFFLFKLPEPKHVELSLKTAVFRIG